MGYFSKTCAKTNMPIVAKDRGWPLFHQVVALTPDKIVRGSYDGYGRVDGEDLQKVWDKVKIVLSHAYEGETYDQLAKSGQELGQGYFMADEFLRVCTFKKSFKNYAEYKRTFKKHANWI